MYGMSNEYLAVDQICDGLLDFLEWLGCMAVRQNPYPSL